MLSQNNNYNSVRSLFVNFTLYILLLFILNTFSKFILVTNFHTCRCVILSYDDGSCFFKIWKRMHFLFVRSTFTSLIKMLWNLHITLSTRKWNTKMCAKKIMKHLMSSEKAHYQVIAEIEKLTELNEKLKT